MTWEAPLSAAQMAAVLDNAPVAIYVSALDSYELFYPQIGVGKRLDGGRRRVKKYLWSF